MSFVHLRTYTEYSFSKGVMKIAPLVRRAKELGMPALAVTDTGGLWGAFEFSQACREQGVKPIIGLEVHVRDLGPGRLPVVLALLAEDAAGWGNLVRLSSACCGDGVPTSPVIAAELLEQCAPGLICLASGLVGAVHESLSQGGPGAARKILQRLADIFVQDRLFLELQNHGLADELSALPELTAIGRELRLPLVAANGCLYLHPDDAEAYGVARARQGSEAGRTDPLAAPDAAECHLKSAAEMRALFCDVPEAVANTLKIAERCNADIEREETAPAFPLPEGCASASELLRRLCEQGLEARGLLHGEYCERLDNELAMLREHGCEQYFLVVRDYLRAARDMGFLVWDRGSAGGSLVNYALDITTSDPLQYGLAFERFLNPTRRTHVPDIDVDVTDRGRLDVVQHLVRTYGAGKVAHVGVVYRVSDKQAARRVAQALECSPADTHRLVHGFLTDPGQDPDQETEGLFFKAARLLAGTPCRVGAHPCGVVIAPRDIDGFAPTCGRDERGVPLLQLTTRAAEGVGLTKFDVIGSKTLALLQEAVRLIRERHGVELDVYAIPEDDPDTFELLKSGRTGGVFQFGSRQMRASLVAARPDSIEHLAALLALCRREPVIQIEEYVARRHGEAPHERIHPLFDKVVIDTYGLVIFQEQIMEIGRRVGGLTLAEADGFRRDLRHRRLENVRECRARFLAGAAANGVEETAAVKAFSAIEEICCYTFNRAHAVTYARLAYRTAFLKAHYALEFVAAHLNVHADRGWSPNAVLDDAAEAGLEVLAPDINLSETQCVVRDEAVRLGLSSIVHCGPAVVSSILDERGRGGPFSDLFDVCSRLGPDLLDRRTLTALIASGALNGLPGTPAQKFAAVDRSLGARSEAGACGAMLAGERKLPEDVDSFDLVREIAAKHRTEVRDLSFDVYCPKTYAHHSRFTLWLAPDTVIFDLDAPAFIERVRSFVGCLEADRNDEYAIGLNSRVDQYAERHLFMLDLDSVDEAAIDRLRTYGGYIMKSGRGYHFIGRTIIPTPEQWRRTLSEVRRTPGLRQHVDDSHIEMSLRRGYSTLRILESPAKPRRPMMMMTL